MAGLSLLFRFNDFINGFHDSIKSRFIFFDYIDGDFQPRFNCSFFPLARFYSRKHVSSFVYDRRFNFLLSCSRFVFLQCMIH